MSKKIFTTKQKNIKYVDNLLHEGYNTDKIFVAKKEGDLLSIARRIGKYMKEKGFNLSEVARKTGLDYQSLYSSLYDKSRKRDLRTEELIPLCIFIGVDPREFAWEGDETER